MKRVSLEEAVKIISNWKSHCYQVGLFGGTFDKVPSGPTAPLCTIEDLPGVPTPSEVVLACRGRPERRLPLQGSSFSLVDTSTGTLPKHASVVEDHRGVGLTIDASTFWLGILEITTSDGSIFSLAATSPALP